MERIINIKVSGHRLSKDNNTAGARGEGNATTLIITLDESWYKYAKSMIFWDANGANPVVCVFTPDRLKSSDGEIETYHIPIPQEAMAIEGKLTFVIEGWNDNKRQRTVYDELIVEESPATPSEPIAPTPTMVEQLQKGIDYAVEKSEETRGYAEDAAYNAYRAELLKDSASLYANIAEIAATKVPNIGANGNWFAWDANDNVFYDTGVKAQSGSVVYVGDNPPHDADVWIFPSGESGISPKRGFIELLGGTTNWKAEDVEDAYGNVIGVRYGQEVVVSNVEIKPNSKVDMQISSEQMVIFYEKDLAFVAENDNGTVTVYCIGSIPQNDYTIQVTVTEVAIDG